MHPHCGQLAGSRRPNGRSLGWVQTYSEQRRGSVFESGIRTYRRLVCRTNCDVLVAVSMIGRASCKLAPSIKTRKTKSSQKAFVSEGISPGDENAIASSAYMLGFEVRSGVAKIETNAYRRAALKRAILEQAVSANPPQIRKFK